jgi:alpha-D-xyloside xylohydrolase
MIRLRYRLIPYLYSTAWQVTSANGSYLRPLFSDFAADKRVWDTTDEFLFGNEILACPILNPQYTQEKIIREDAMTGWDRKKVESKNEDLEIDWTATKSATKYLPKGADWYDFWTGERLKGGRDITIATNIDRVPMFVRAGSILPLGPEMQYVGEKTWDNLEIRIYPGANGEFTLYEDEGDNYNYEQGYYSNIIFKWNDRSRTLSISARQGGYKGMILERTFNVMLPDGTSKVVHHNGNEVKVKL